METSGNTIIILKDFLYEHGEESELQVLKQLSLQAQTFYHNIKINTWVPMQIASEIKHAGAAVLFPNKSDGIFQLQRMIAQKIASDYFQNKQNYIPIKTVINSVEQIWNDLWHKGTIHVKTITDRNLTLVVTEFPELIQSERHMIQGHITGILDLTGARNIRGKTDAKKPTAWQWVFSWK